MKNILLVCPNTSGNLFETRWVTPHVGMWRLSSYLNANGHNCEVFDCQHPDKQSFESIINSKKWDIIGFSILEASVEYDFKYIFEAKKLSPDSIIVAGGSGAALNYQFILDNAPVDIVVLLEGEFPILDLCNDKRWQDIDGIVFKKRAKILTQKDFWNITETINFKKMEVDKYWNRTAALYKEPNINEINTFRLFTSNYCPMGCKFCTLTLWKKYASGCMPKVVGLTPEQIINTIKKVLISYPQTKQIYFTDDDFFILKQEREEFCRLVIKEKDTGGLPTWLSFIIMTNIIRFSEENIALMKQMGVKVLSAGVESTSQDVLNSYSKKQNVETIWRVTDWILKSGIKPYYTLILFSPHMKMKDLFIHLKDFRRMSSLGVGISVEPYLIPLPGTQFWEDRVPMSSRWVPIEGTNIKINKGFAWLPIDKEVLRVFTEFEKWYPKYRKYRFDTDGVGHKEKNYQGNLILDALEIVLKNMGYFDFDGKLTTSEARRKYLLCDKMEAVNVDIVGDFTH